MADFEIIERQSDLESLAKDLVKEKIVAVDTEADSFYHYFDKTCLVQIATRKASYLIDPLALGGPAELAPLGPVFASSKIRKVFHAAEYDIFVLKRDCGFTFSNLYDTMVSAQLLGYPAIGLAALIEHHFGLKVTSGFPLAARDRDRSLMPCVRARASMLARSRRRGASLSSRSNMVFGISRLVSRKTDARTRGKFTVDCAVKNTYIGRRASTRTAHRFVNEDVSDEQARVFRLVQRCRRQPKGPLPAGAEFYQNCPHPRVHQAVGRRQSTASRHHVARQSDHCASTKQAN